MVRKLLMSRKFWHQGHGGLKHQFDRQNFFNALRLDIDRDVGEPRNNFMGNQYTIMNRFPLIEWKYLFFFHPNTSTSTPVQDPSPPVRVNLIEEDHLIIIFSNIGYHRLLFKLPTYDVDYTPSSEYPENEHEDVEISDSTIRTL